MTDVLMRPPGAHPFLYLHVLMYACSQEGYQPWDNESSDEIEWSLTFGTFGPPSCDWRDWCFCTERDTCGLRVAFAEFADQETPNAIEGALVLAQDGCQAYDINRYFSLRKDSIPMDRSRVPDVHTGICDHPLGTWMPWAGVYASSVEREEPRRIAEANRVRVLAHLYLTRDDEAGCAKAQAEGYREGKEDAEGGMRIRLGVMGAGIVLGELLARFATKGTGG